MKKDLVPPAPLLKIRIKAVEKTRLREWVSFFNHISPRIVAFLPDIYSEGFIRAYNHYINEVKEKKGIEDEEIIGWPTPNQIAFIVKINSSTSNTKCSTYNLDDTYFFCFDSKAFGVAYFEWDGDGETGYDPKTYSLDQYSSEALSWEYIKKIIIEKVEELENRVPKLTQ